MVASSSVSGDTNTQGQMMMNAANEQTGLLRTREAARGLGTFAGVFTPSVLTILGIILFRRLGYVVGTAGLASTLVIVAVATLISVLTSVSLSAVATNIKVKKGGDYYLISRTLGVEFGGAIGLVLFLAQAVSIAFYCIGFGEAIAGITGVAAPYLVRLIAAGAAAVLLILAWLGADIATKFQFVVMAVLGVALVSFFGGSFSAWSGGNLAQSWFAGDSKTSFWVVFAIFFPAVTGFTQGVSMSGDLRDPARSLPRGTFAAIGLSTLIYVAALVAFAGALPLSELASDYDAMRRVAGLPWLVDAGVIAATLSSAMASFLGAPRILQSLAGDKIFRFLTPFAKGAGPAENPRRGVMLAAGICFVAIALGNLNLIAPVVSMFVLVSYGLLNYATYFEARASSPSFRPRFRWFDRRLSLLGALLCVGVMIAIDLPAAAVSGAILFGMFQYLKRTAGPARWADSKRADLFRRVRENLLAMESEQEHPRDWRPHILAFSDDFHRREKLLRFASWIEGGAGLTTAVRFLVGDGPAIRKQRLEVEKTMRREIQECGVAAFSLCMATPDMLLGARMLLQAYGTGPLRANVILLNWLEQVAQRGAVGKERQYGSYLRAAVRLSRNVVVLEAEEDQWEKLVNTPPSKRRIDVWWFDDPSSRLLLLLAYLMTRTEAWADAHIRVLAATASDDNANESQQNLGRMLEDIRIDAQAEVMVATTGDDVVRHSEEATLVLLPMRLNGDQPLGPFRDSIEELVSRLPITALAIAGEDIDLAAEPDTGPAAEFAAVQDHAEEKAAKAKEAEQQVEKAVRSAEVAEDAVIQAAGEDKGEEERIRKEAERLRTEAERLVRKAAKARAASDAAQKALDEAAPPTGSREEKRPSDS